MQPRTCRLKLSDADREIRRSKHLRLTYLLTRAAFGIRDRSLVTADERRANNPGPFCRLRLSPEEAAIRMRNRARVRTWLLLEKRCPDRQLRPSPEERQRLKQERADARYEAKIRRWRTKWLFLATVVPGCTSPLKCKVCKNFFGPWDYRKSSRRCRACDRTKNREGRARMKVEDPARFKAMRKRAKHRRKALLRGNGGSYTEAEWQSILKSWDYRCARCGTDGEMTVDHILPLSLGGRNVAKNLQPMCHLCNSLKSATVTGATQCFIPGILTYASP